MNSSPYRNPAAVPYEKQAPQRITQRQLNQASVALESDSLYLGAGVGATLATASSSWFIYKFFTEVSLASLALIPPLILGLSLVFICGGQIYKAKVIMQRWTNEQ